MNSKQLYTMYAAGLAAILLLLGGWWAIDRGILFFDNWKPSFSLADFREPSLDRKLTFPEAFDENTRNLISQNIEKTKSAIRSNTNPDDIAGWLDLAISYRALEDYEGAVEIWEWIVSKNPNESISLHNLGEHYFHEANDYATAENYYFKSIAAAPQLGQNYLDLFDMYRYAYKTHTDSAVEILKRGVTSVSAQQGVAFLVLLGQYSEEGGDTEKARIYFQEALTIAKRIDSTAQIKQVQELLNTLK